MNSFSLYLSCFLVLSYLISAALMDKTQATNRFFSLVFLALGVWGAAAGVSLATGHLSTHIYGFGILEILVSGGLYLLVSGNNIYSTILSGLLGGNVIAGGLLLYTISR